MPHAMQNRQTGAPEVLNWTAVDVGEPGPDQVRAGTVEAVAPGCARSEGRRSGGLCPVLIKADRFALKVAADAHKTVEARATSGSTVLTVRTRKRSLQRSIAVAFAASALAFGVVGFAAGRPLPDLAAVLAAAVADSSRPESDATRDADRKPEQTLVFSGIKPGDRAADYVADAGYFTRLFASVVGSKGHVYAVEPTAFFKFEHFVKAVAELQGYAVTHPNITVTTAAALEGLKFPEKLDLFWISRNYHDLHDEFMGPVDIAAFNKAVYSALKPGGFYVILDHSAALGAPTNVTETLHRIESSTVRREVEAAGFKFASESSILANPADPRTAKVFDQTIRGHTDQFILKFRKPR